MREKDELLIVIARFLPAIGGSELHTFRLAQELSRYYSVSVAYLTHNDSVSNERGICDRQAKLTHQSNVKIIHLYQTGVCFNALAKLAHFYENSRVARLVFHSLLFFYTLRCLHALKARPKILHVIYNGLSASLLSCLIFARFNAIKLSFQPLLNSEVSEKKVHCIFKRLMFYFSDIIYCLSTAEAEFIQPFAKATTQLKVFKFPPLTTQVPKNTSHSKQFTVLFLGRLQQDKGFDLLLAAAQSLKQRHHDFRFVFAGPLNQTHSKQKTEIAEIIFLGAVDEKEKCLWLQKADILCVPSRIESQGVAFYEAIDFGLPFIAGDTLVTRELVEQSGAGILCQHSVEDVIQKILTLKSDTALRALCRGNALAYKSNFTSWKKLACILREDFQLLIGGKL